MVYSSYSNGYLINMRTEFIWAAFGVATVVGLMTKKFTYNDLLSIY